MNPSKNVKKQVRLHGLNFAILVTGTMNNNNPVDITPEEKKNMMEFQRNMLY